ncbi:P63C domain-containing protein [Leucobacter sp. OH1287]|uniref:P63C domain-containing protein n=1 Tax=Leucobacter sp. OH1287 TaxID=2491049 RepID=UPI000F5D8BA0|nr:P63C domain-containing protein [Leucobacter sp. OH1287]RRD61388.1 hypothetical protein EII30_03030 [Leucobacter sp. OH1287]
MNNRSNGGKKRAENLSAEQRSLAAKHAATARWKQEPLLKTVSGSPDRPLRIGDVEIECYVLEDGTRVITQSGMLEALGRSRRLNKTPDADMSLPPILRTSAIRPYLSEELIKDAEPIRFITNTNARANGYRAEVLPLWCEAWLAARENGALAPNQSHAAKAAEVIMRGLARVGIIALIDEVTGYQEKRARDALAQILEAYVEKELQPWVKTFDTEWYKELFRLRGLKFDVSSVKKPSYFGYLTNNIVYKRLAPGVFEEIKAERAKDERKRRAKMHQQLTPEFGHPKLREHIASTTAIMKLSKSWEEFMSNLDRVHPVYGSTTQLPLWDDETGL